MKLEFTWLRWDTAWFYWRYWTATFMKLFLGSYVLCEICFVRSKRRGALLLFLAGCSRWKGINLRNALHGCKLLLEKSTEETSHPLGITSTEGICVVYDDEKSFRWFYFLFFNTDGVITLWAIAVPFAPFITIFIFPTNLEEELSVRCITIPNLQPSPSL